MMKKIIIILGAALLAVGCKKTEQTNPLTLKLSPDKVQGKSGQTIEATLVISTPFDVKSISIYKTVNLEKDNEFGDQKVVPEQTSVNGLIYTFTYHLKPEEVDKLVGINFRVEDTNGNYAEKDLTIHTITSGWQTIYSRKWKLVSRMWVTVTPNVEDLKDCEKDDVYSFNRDSTYNINFGKSACTFDGFNVYDFWQLSQDEKTFITKYHSVFDPSNKTTETYTVVSISSDKLVMYQTLDLTIFGFTDKERFVYTFEPAS